MAETRRLFAGIALDDATRDACARASERLRATGFAARYDDPSKYHVTLAFLGNVDAGRVAEIGAALAAAAATCAPFAITVERLGAFPHERKPRIVYAGTRDAGAGYRALASAVREHLAALGFVFPGDAVVHVTIARVKESKRPLPQVDVTPATFEVGGVALFESLFDPGAKTSRYEIVATHPLPARQARVESAGK